MGSASLILLWVISIESLIFSFFTSLKNTILPFFFVALIIAPLLTALKPFIKKKLSIVGSIVGILISIGWEIPVIVMHPSTNKTALVPNVISELSTSDSTKSGSDNANAIKALNQVNQEAKFKVFTVTDALDKTKLPSDSLYLSAVNYDRNNQTLDLQYQYPRTNKTIHMWEAPTSLVSKDVNN